MNAIMSLCHFCELHGPSILYCTQAFHSDTPDQVLEDGTTPEEPGTFLLRDQRQRSITETSSSSACGDQLPSKTSDTCEACRSLSAGQSGFVSHDHEAKVSYVSKQYPNHPQVFSLVRQACVRSLSCEVCPGREGPIFFGDDHRGHVLSYTFFIKDSQARGLQRWYSIIIVMMDKIFLLNSWPFLVKHLQSVINELQEKALRVYENEQAKCPQRAQRLTMSMSTTPANFRQQRGANKAARSLVELTSDKHVFKKLHQSFAWILKAGGNRLTETLLEGPPTEDSIIDLEKQEETEEGFVKLFSKKVDDVVENKHEDEDVDMPGPVFTDICHILKVLGYDEFHCLAHHIVIGNQVIIQGYCRSITKSMVEALKVLLPKGCCRVILNSQTYEDSWRCNFLGIPHGVNIPAHVDLYVLVTVTERMESDEENPDGDELDKFKFEISSPITLPDKSPGVLKKMESALLNEKLPPSCINKSLICLKEEWMNKVKVLFKFTKAGGNRSEEDTRKLLQVVGAHEEDKQVLMFWMTGLSVQYRNHMLSSAKTDGL